MKRPLRAEERTLWQAAMKGVRRLIDGAPPAVIEPTPQPMAASQPATMSASPPAVKPRHSKAVPPVPGFLDSETERRLEKGSARIDALLDLHGMTEREAYDALVSFVEEAVHHGHRVLLVVTGKGKMGKGVLRRNLPLWLEGPGLRPHVSGFRHAFTRHGGDGAIYVTLRRRVRK